MLNFDTSKLTDTDKTLLTDVLVGAPFKDRNRFRVINAVESVEIVNMHRIAEIDSSKVCALAKSKTSYPIEDTVVFDIVFDVIDESKSSPTLQDQNQIQMIARDVIVFADGEGIGVEVVNGFKIMNKRSSGYRDMFWQDNYKFVNAFEDAVRRMVFDIVSYF